MRSFEQYEEICKHFTEGKQRDNDANEIQKYLQLYNLSLGEYLTDRYALWPDFRMIEENELQGMGRRIENASEGITLQTEKKSESAGALNAYIYLIMDAQLNIQNGTYISVAYKINKMFMKEPHTALFVTPTRVGKNSFSIEPT